MQHKSLDGQPGLGDEAALQNCMPSNAFSDLDIQDPVPTVSTPALAEESLTMKQCSKLLRSRSFGIYLLAQLLGAVYLDVSD